MSPHPQHDNQPTLPLLPLPSLLALQSLRLGSQSARVLVPRLLQLLMLDGMGAEVIGKHVTAQVRTRVCVYVCPLVGGWKKRGCS